MNDSLSRLEAVNQTVIHPLALAVVLLLGAMLLLAPRRYAVLPLLALLCLIPATQRIVVMSLDFNFLRLLLLAGWLRLVLRGEWVGLRWIVLDTVFVAWVGVSSIAYIALHGSSAIVFKLGYAYDAIGAYFYFRCVIRSWRDIRQLAIGMAALSIPVAVAFGIEWATARNMFSVFGGVQEITKIREGQLRCQGAFPHPILAGTFWASQLPLITLLWWNDRRLRPLVVVALLAGLFIIFACGSSTPLGAVVCGFIGIACFACRAWTRLIRWGVLCCIILLHFIMTKPVWHLISRIDLVGGSTGWHRYKLIDQLVRRFSEWWLLGTETTAHWGHNLSDVTNEFVLQGIRGGLLSLLLFISMIFIAFAYVGRIRVRVCNSRHDELVIWLLGVTLFVHVSAFMAVSYFAQITVVWYLAVAMVGSMMAARDVAMSPRPSGARRAVQGWIANGSHLTQEFPT